MEPNYYKKYIKYYKKYKNMHGGATNQSNSEISEKISDPKCITSFFGTEYKYFKIEYEMNGKKVYIIKIVLNEDTDKPILFALAGMSQKSFLGTSNIIISKLDVLCTKFKEIYLLEYSSFNIDQNKAFKEQGILINAAGGEEIFKKMLIEDKLNGGFFKPVIELNTRIADLTKTIINRLNLSNIHLLGKCNGAGITIILIANESNPDIYKGLYLAVPGVASSVQDLFKLTATKLQDINFVFGWTKQDEYDYKWSLKSFQEKYRYDTIMATINKIKNIDMTYHSIMYDNKCQSHVSDYHEIYPDMIDLIVKTVNP